MQYEKKIRPDQHFLEFVRDYYKLESIDVYKPLSLTRQYYWDICKKKRIYNFEAMEMKHFARLLGVSVESLADCVHRYLFK